MRVLAAEDDSRFRPLLERAITLLGHECELASDGVEAWERFQRTPSEVVIADWLMPRLSGPELCRKIRDHGGGPYTYFVLLTALDDKQHFLMGMRSGADDYLTKPLDIEELEVRLETAERVTSLHRQLADQNARLARLLAEQQRLSDELAELAQTRGRLEGVTLAAREIAHLVSNDLMLAEATLDLLQSRSELPEDVRSRLRQALDGLGAADEHLKKLQQVVRVETKETPVGPSLDLERSTAD